MNGYTLQDLIYDSNYFTVLLPSSDNIVTFETAEFSEKPSRPSKSLVDINLHKSFIELKNRIPNCSNWEKWSKLVHMYDKLDKNDELLEIKEYVNFNTVLDTYEDYSQDPDNKEQLTFRNFFNMYLESIGSDVLVFKIYDTFTRPVCQLIYLMTLSYREVRIVKTRVSRYTNSEKYIILSGYKGVDYSEKLYDIKLEWNENLFCRNIGVHIPVELENIFQDHNKKMIDLNCMYIERVFDYNYLNDNSLDKQICAFQNNKVNEFNIIFKNQKNTCKHLKKTKVDVLQNSHICSTCFMILI